MLMSLLSHALSAWFAFLLPCYGTFKALSHRPLSEPDLQRWSMYWAVIGAFVAFEYLAEWLISWLPFYWEFKTLFLLFLSLPQTQGSTYIYTTYLQPFFVKHEADLDAGIITVQRNTLAFVTKRLGALWEFVWSLLNKSSGQAQSAQGRPSAAGTSQSGASGAPAFNLQSAMGLWNTYGSSVKTMLGGEAPSTTPAASSTGYEGDSAQRRPPMTPGAGSSRSSSFVTEDQRTPSNAPSFPVPQHA